MSYSIISCPPNYLWQTWLEAAFPGYSESLTSQEKEKLVDEKVAGRSTATDTTSLRSRDERKATITSESSPSPQKAKKQLKKAKKNINIMKYILVEWLYSCLLGFFKL